MKAKAAPPKNATGYIQAEISVYNIQQPNSGVLLTDKFVEGKSATRNVICYSINEP